MKQCLVWSQKKSLNISALIRWTSASVQRRMELSTGILSGYIILNGWGSTNLVFMQRWQSLEIVASLAQLQQKLPWGKQDGFQNLSIWHEWCMQNAIFFLIPVYLDSEKSLTKEEDALYKGFLSLVMNLTKHILCIAFHHHRDQTLPGGYRRTNLASCKKKCTHACATWSWGCPDTGALCWQEGRTWFDLFVLRKAHSMLKTTVMISELPPPGKCTDILLYVSHTTKQLLGSVYMQWSSDLRSFRQAKKLI